MPSLGYRIGAAAAQVPNTLAGIGRGIGNALYPGPGIGEYLAQQAEEVDRGFSGAPDMGPGPSTTFLPPGVGGPDVVAPPAIEQAIAAQAPPVAMPRPAPTPSIQAGAYTGQDMPRWSGVGGGPRTAGQIEQDMRARGLLQAENDQVMSGIEADLARRGDPMEKAIEAQGQTLKYERGLPSGSQSRVQASMGGMEIGGNYGSGSDLGGPTTGELLDFDRRLALQQSGQPKDRLAIEQAVARKTEIAKLQALAAENARRVAAKILSPEMADAEMHRAMVIAAQRGALSEGDFSALGKLLFPDADNVPGGPMSPGALAEKR